MTTEPIFLFYEEPDPDRWISGDRYPRRWIRRILRGPSQPGGVMRWYLNLLSGLRIIGAPVHINDYRGLSRTPGAWAHVVGKPHVIDRIPPGHPIIYGPGVAAHPFENDFWIRADIRLILLSCPWFKDMYAADLPRRIPVAVWPAGVETDLWQPPAEPPPSARVLVYDKIRWQHDRYKRELVDPILGHLHNAGLRADVIRYGSYHEEEYRRLLQEVGAMVFLCEHETQGFAYLQALSCGVPIFAWDRGGFWQDPSMFPDRVKFQPVTSVPYFDRRCGRKFADQAEFQAGFSEFFERVRRREFSPRSYVVENFDLARRAREYLALSAAVRSAR